MTEKGEFPQNPTVDQPKIERDYPQYQLINEKIQNVFQKTGLIVGESALPRSENEKRTLAERMDRAETYKEVKKIKKEEDKNFVSKLEKDIQGRKESFDKASVFFDKAHELDKIFVQFTQNQKEVRVNIDGLGEQMARYVILEPSETSDKPPIILIPGISNDLEGNGELPIKLAASGRKVIMIAYPESWHGEVTEKFGDAVEKSNNYGPHTEFFKSAIKQITDENSKIDLCGESTGSLIVSNLLADNEMKQRVDEATMIVPPGEITHKHFDTVSMLKETLDTFKKLPLISKLTVVNPKKIETTDEHRRLMLHTYESLKKKVISKYIWWERPLLTGTGKKTNVIIGGNDHVTEAKKGRKEIEANPTLNLHLIKSGNHSTPLVESDMVIELVKSMQGKE